MYSFVTKYKVLPGDTLYELSRRFETSPKQIMRVNHEITDPDVIYAGQIINIPEVRPLITYIVKQGDTLWNIIQDYNVELMKYYGVRITLDEVLAYNPGISDPDLIYTDEIIYLPEIL